MAKGSERISTEPNYGLFQTGQIAREMVDCARDGSKVVHLSFSRLCAHVGNRERAQLIAARSFATAIKRSEDPAERCRLYKVLRYHVKVLVALQVLSKRGIQFAPFGEEPASGNVVWLTKGEIRNYDTARMRGFFTPAGTPPAAPVTVVGPILKVH